MMKRIMLSVISLVGLVAVLQFTSPSPVLAQFNNARDEACSGLGAQNDAGASDGFINCDDTGESTVNSVLAAALNILSVVAGVIAVIMMIIAGIKFLTSQGDAGAVASARNTVIYAVVGIVIVVMSQVVVRFVIDRATGERLPAPSSQVDSEIEPRTNCPPGESCPQ